MSSPPLAAGETEPGQALSVLALILRDEATVISPHVIETTAAPALGALAAAGARAAQSPLEYALVVESVREGYLLHYGDPRLLAGHDLDLALLAGDYLYARGIERLASLGDAVAVRELADLISLLAQCHAESHSELAGPLWLAVTVAVGVGGTAAHEAAKQSARRQEPEAGARLLETAAAETRRAGLGALFHRAAKAIDFSVPEARDG